MYLSIYAIKGLFPLIPTLPEFLGLKQVWPYPNQAKDYNPHKLSSTPSHKCHKESASHRPLSQPKASKHQYKYAQIPSTSQDAVFESTNCSRAFELANQKSKLQSVSRDPVFELANQEPVFKPPNQCQVLANQKSNNIDNISPKDHYTLKLHRPRSPPKHKYSYMPSSASQNPILRSPDLSNQDTPQNRPTCNNSNNNNPIQELQDDSCHSNSSPHPQSRRTFPKQENFRTVHGGVGVGVNKGTVRRTEEKSKLPSPAYV